MAITVKLPAALPRTTRAFTLAELLLSLALMTIVIVTVASLFISMYRTQEKSARSSTGVRVAETVINAKLHSIFSGLEPGLSKAQFFANDAPPQPVLSGSLVLSGTEYLYRLEHETVVQPGGTTLGSGLAENRLKIVSVTCWWWGADEASTRAGHGKQTVSLRRMVNENDKF
jgi:hypothetical protein